MEKLQPSKATQRARNRELGFTLIELLMAIIVLLVGIVAVAQLVPASISSNATNRNDSSALVFAQREMNELRSRPLGDTLFVDPLGVSCPVGETCNLGDPTQPNQVIGSPVVVINNQPVVDFSVAQVANYSFNYQDPNDPFGTTYDVRWAVITTTNGGRVTAKRFILGARKVGGNGFYQPVTIDTMVEK